MTKKQFIALADVMRSLEPKPLPFEETDPTKWTLEQKLEFSAAMGKDTQWAKTRETLADFCKSQNPAFKRERWIDYINGECGPNGGRVKK